MKITFLLARKKDVKTSVVIAAIRYKNYRVNYCTQVSVPPKFWDEDNMRVRETKQIPEHKTLNEKLINFKAKVSESFLRFKHENNEMIPEPKALKVMIDNIYQKKDVQVIKTFTFLGYLREMIEQSKKGIRIHPKSGKPIAKDTIKTYTTTLTHLETFEKHKRKPIQFNDINLDFYEDYKSYLIKKKQFSNNTIGKHFQIIKLVMNEATDRGITSNLAYKSRRFFVIRENTDNVFLTEKEIEAMAKKDFSKQRNLDITRDLFVIGCMTGLRYSDFNNIQPEQIENGFISVTQDKTGGKIVIPVHPLVKQILVKYNNKLPKGYSNQKMNMYLKDVAGAVECLQESVSKEFTKGGQTIIKNAQKSDLVTTHTARRSFATNEIKKGTPVSVVMAITGHKTEKSFWKYIKLSKSDYAVMLKDIWDKRDKKSKLKAV